MEAVNPDAAGGDHMTPLMTISTALYVCEGCDDAGECNCYHADQLRYAPTHQWLCETCYDVDKAEDDSGEVWPAWDDLVRHPCMAAELIEARVAIAHMHDMIWLMQKPKARARDYYCFLRSRKEKDHKSFGIIIKDSGVTIVDRPLGYKVDERDPLFETVFFGPCPTDDEAHKLAMDFLDLHEQHQDGRAE